MSRAIPPCRGQPKSRRSIPIMLTTSPNGSPDPIRFPGVVVSRVTPAKPATAVVASVLDHDSRRVVAVGCFANKPTAESSAHSWACLPQTNTQAHDLRS